MKPFEELEMGEKACKRAGIKIKSIFKKEDKHFTDQECMLIKDMYGFSPRHIPIMAFGLDFTYDKEGFEKLLLIDEDIRKNMRQCEA